MPDPTPIDLSRYRIPPLGEFLSGGRAVPIIAAVVVILIVLTS